MRYGKAEKTKKHPTSSVPSLGPVLGGLLDPGSLMHAAHLSFRGIVPKASRSILLFRVARACICMNHLFF